jgi:flagellum-specific peptidoglycan hydrolase FlgJ
MEMRVPDGRVPVKAALSASPAMVARARMKGWRVERTKATAMVRGAASQEREDWLKKIPRHARAAKRDSNHAVFVSVQLAQTIPETGWGSSELFRKAWNIGGVKGKGDAGSVMMPTTEYIRGVRTTVTASFARYWKAMQAQTPEEQIREMHRA